MKKILMLDRSFSCGRITNSVGRLLPAGYGYRLQAQMVHSSLLFSFQREDVVG